MYYINVNGFVNKKPIISDISSDTDMTYTPDQIFGSCIKRTNIPNVIDKLPSAKEIISCIKFPVVGNSIYCYIYKNSNSNTYITLKGGDGIHMANSQSHNVINLNITNRTIPLNSSFFIYLCISDLTHDKEKIQCYVGKTPTITDNNNDRDSNIDDAKHYHDKLSHNL
jgi:hypothetical protein